MKKIGLVAFYLLIVVVGYYAIQWARAKSASNQQKANLTTASNVSYAYRASVEQQAYSRQVLQGLFGIGQGTTTNEDTTPAGAGPATNTPATQLASIAASS
jgi:hypothetical protein